MDKYRSLLNERAAVLTQKKATFAPERAVFAEVITRTASQSKETLTRQLFREDQVQQIFEQLDQVRDALQRVNDGSYGACCECGGEISASRLQLLPETPFCLSCQRTTELG
ncbi:MAG: hypothetical protein DRQ52_09275 [Gammaproteobacteria bacterium]|nr:MAG: hypothetical protein DRQ52_09275 [Gammaproteobacteria bacterium]